MTSPLSVVTTPCGVTRRITSFPESATYAFPAPSTATPVGDENLAWLPAPSSDPLRPGFPARVVTTPSGVIRRSVWPWMSVTKTLPPASTATPSGPVNRAALPMPSSPPEAPARPARVETSPAGVTLRTVQFRASAT
ncbi:MAG: hypothetical protein IPP07_16250 [Holophagales bacterium]|nr:hypothetical protein [Holophagales bacterium]